MQPITVVADMRERASGIPRALSLKGLEVRLQNLWAGDYVPAPHLAIERKTTADFIQSIYDNRLFGQVQLLRASFPHAILLLEQGDAPQREIHPHALRGAFLYVSVQNHIPILHSQNSADSVELIHAIVQLLHQEPQRSFSLHEKKRTGSMALTQRYVLETLPGIGPQLADALLKQFGSLQAVFAAPPESLEQVKGIGRGRAARIHEILNRHYGKKE